LRFQVLTAASMKFRFVFWDVLPCKIIVDRRFRGTCCLHHQGADLNSIMFLLFTCMHFWVWGILRRWSACAPITYEVVRNCRKFEKHYFKVTSVHPSTRKYVFSVSLFSPNFRTVLYISKITVQLGIKDFVHIFKYPVTQVNNSLSFPKRLVKINIFILFC
jgi:hypothetical protein